MKKTGWNSKTMEYLKENTKKYSHLITYIIFGGLTTLVNFAVYIACRNSGIEYVISNIIAWFIAVVFAFFTNKVFVFHSKNYKVKFVLLEFIQFISFRFFAGAFETAALYLMVEYLSANELIVKVFLGIIIVISNYIFSKFVIFNKRT